MQPSKRRWLIAAPLAAGAALLLASRPALAGKTRVIRIEARKFRFAPDRIELKRGEAAELELLALDFPHGFSIPEFKLRMDLVPGQVLRLKFTPARAGQFTFLCDNFCGGGHEEMGGTLVVT